MNTQFVNFSKVSVYLQYVFKLVAMDKDLT